MVKQAKIRDRLTRSRSRLEVVRVFRRAGWDRLDGYVMDVGAKWVLLAVVDDRCRPDGFSVVRIRDVARVERGRTVERFLRRALELEGFWPLEAPATRVRLDRTRDLVADLVGGFPLLSVFDESDYPDAVFIGRPQEYNGSSFLMREVDASAQWYGPKRRDWSHWRFGELTRVDVGDGYASILARVAGTPPR